MLEALARVGPAQLYHSCTTGDELSPAFCGHICSAAAYRVPTSAETPGRTSWPALSENTKGQAQGPCRICLCMLSKQPTCQNIDRRVGRRTADDHRGRLWVAVEDDCWKAGAALDACAAPCSSYSRLQLLFRKLVGISEAEVTEGSFIRKY